MTDEVERPASAVGRVGVVVNPTAGRGRGAAGGRRVVEALRAAGWVVSDLSAPSYPLALESAREAVGDVDALVVVGGDGMVHLGVNAVASTGVPLGVVAVGTGNDFAHAVGLPVGDVERASVAVVEALSGTPRRVDAAEVTGAHVRGSRWFAGVLSAGIDAAVNAHANAVAWPRGRARYARSALTQIVRFRPYGYRVRVEGVSGPVPSVFAGASLCADGDGWVWQSSGSVVAVANGSRIGGGIRIAPDAVVDDGLLDVVVAGPFTRWGAARIFPGMYAGRHVGNSMIGVLRARSVTIERTDDGAPPPASFADGERVGALPVTVRVRPGALRVLAPHPVIPGTFTGGEP